MRKVIGFIFLSMLLVACEHNANQAQGYVEGHLRYLSVNYSGVLKKLSVRRGDQVQVGQLLFELDPQPEKDAVNQAAAKLELAKITLERYQKLMQKNALQQSELDKAQSNYLQAQAALSQAEWTQKQKIMLAPNTAFVFDTYFLPGELVPASKPVLSLLAPQDIKVNFFISEPELSSMQIGQIIAISCDGCKRKINAKISFISPQAEYTPPVLYSESRRSKLVYRIEAMPVKLVDAIALHPGQPVKVRF